MQKSKLIFTLTNASLIALPIFVVTSCNTNENKERILGDRINKPIYDAIVQFVNKNWTNEPVASIEEKILNKINEIVVPLGCPKVVSVAVDLTINIKAGLKDAIVNVEFESDVPGILRDFTKNKNIISTKNLIETGMNNYFNTEGTTLEIPNEVTTAMYQIIEKYSKQYWVNDSQYPWEGMGRQKYDEMIMELNNMIKTNFIGFPLINEIRNWGAALRDESQFSNKSTKVTIFFNTECLVKVVGQPDDVSIADQNNQWFGSKYESSIIAITPLVETAVPKN